MFAKLITIIYFSKEKIKFSIVKFDKKPVVLKSATATWSEKSLKNILFKLKSQIKGDVRILLADDLSYVLRLKLPLSVKPSMERQQVAELVKYQIPEILDNEDWDFKESGKKTKDEKEVVVFAPVKDSFMEISQAFVDAAIEVSAIEPEAISKLRHEDTILGLALKTDIKGKDELVLNLSLLSSADEWSDRKQAFLGKKWLAILAMIVVTSLVAVITFLKFK